MKSHLNITVLILALSFTILSSCSDVWETHYKVYNTQKSELSVYKYIKSQSDLKIFAKLLEVTEYDSVLCLPQSFTVWAPNDEALNNVIDTLNIDTVQALNMVRTHMTRSLHSVSGLTSEEVYLLNGKFTTFKNSGNSELFFGIAPLNLSKSDVGTLNGIVHVLNGYLPFKPNLWEFINNEHGFDSIKAFFNSKSVYEFDEKNSIEIGTNKFGQSVYDSVKIFSNSILDQIGAINDEDSTYTMLIPSNKAWTTAYNQVLKRYKTFSSNSSAAQRYNAQMALASFLVFDTLVTEPASLTDIKTTSGTRFKNPAYLFESSVKKEMSNGVIYYTDSLRFKPSDTYQKIIKVEAEDVSYGRSHESANPTIRTAFGSVYADSISEIKYLYAEPQGTTFTSMKINFPIPNTLSGKYNIYCVFVPTTITTQGSTKGYKFRFYLSYLNVDGEQITDASVLKDHSLNTIKGSVGEIFSTKAGVITKFFVTQMTFPYCNLYKTGDAFSTITTSLKIQDALSGNETTKFDKNLRIDCIILEPAD